MPIPHRYPSQVINLCNADVTQRVLFYDYVFHAKGDLPFLALECAAYLGRTDYLEEVCDPLSEYPPHLSPIEIPSCFLSIRKGAMLGDRPDVYQWAIRKNWYRWTPKDVDLAARLGSNKVLMRALADQSALPELILRAAVYHRDDGNAFFWWEQLVDKPLLPTFYLKHLVDSSYWRRIVHFCKDPMLPFGQRQDLFRLLWQRSREYTDTFRLACPNLQWPLPLTEALSLGWISPEQVVSAYFEERDLAFAAQILDIYVDDAEYPAWAKKASWGKYPLDSRARNLVALGEWGDTEKLLLSI